MWVKLASSCQACIPCLKDQNFVFVPLFCGPDIPSQGKWEQVGAGRVKMHVRVFIDFPLFVDSHYILVETQYTVWLYFWL